MAGGWRKLYNEELHNSYSSPKIIKMIKLRRIGACGMDGGDEKCNILAGKPVEKRSLRRPRHRWKHNIKMDLRVGRCGLHSSGSG
jgi:hypothetical protein